MSPAGTPRCRKVRRACKQCGELLECSSHLCIKGVSVAGHAPAHRLELLSVRVVGCQQEGGVPAHFAPVPMPGANGHQVQRIPQLLAVVPAASAG